MIVMGSNMDREDSMLYIKALEQGTGDINWMVRLSKMGLEGQILQMAKEEDNFKSSLKTEQTQGFSKVKDNKEENKTSRNMNT